MNTGREEERAGVRTYFRTLFEDDDAHVAAFFALELLEADGCTETRGASADDADVDVVGCTLDIVWVEELASAESSGV